MNPFDLPGPAFLAYYTVLAFVVVAAAVLVRRRVLEPGGSGAAPDPYALALLANEPEDVVRTAVVTLLDRGALLPGEKGDEGKLLASPDGTTPAHFRAPIERAVVEAAGRRVAPARLPRDRGVLAAVEEVRATLVRRGLLADRSVRVRRGVLLGVVLAILLGVAGTKMVIGVKRGRPIEFLVILTVLATAAAAGTSGITARRTAAGDRMLLDMRTYLARARTKLASSSRSPGEPEVLLCAAAWGSDSLPDAVTAPWSGALPPRVPRTRRGHDGGGDSYPWSCGGSTCGAASSSASSCGGSSCSSSSCGGGGGGCGGCGS